MKIFSKHILNCPPKNFGPLKVLTSLKNEEKPQKNDLPYVLGGGKKKLPIMTTPFNFADWYGPKQLSKHIGCDTEKSRKIFERSRSQTRDLQTLYFWLKFKGKIKKSIQILSKNRVFGGHAFDFENSQKCF